MPDNDNPFGGGEHHERSSGLEKSLTGDVGGIPVWLLGLLLGGGLILFFIIRNRNRATTAAAATATNTTAATASTPDGSSLDPNAVDPNSATGLTYAEENYPSGPVDSYLSQDATNPAYPVGLPPQGLPGPVTNVQWARLAGDYLIGKGDDPSLVNNALNGYVDGKPLTTAEQAIVNLALTTFGEPPEGVVPVITAPPTTDKDPRRKQTRDKDKDRRVTDNDTNPARHPGPAHNDLATYTVKPGDSWWSIAERYYGNGARQETIQDANPRIRRLLPGEKLLIPVS